MKYQVIDEQGTVVWEFRANLARDRIKVVKGVSAGYEKVGEGKRFVKVWRDFPSGLTLEEYGLLYVLCTKVCYGDNGVRAGGLKRGGAVSAKMLSEELGVGYRKVLKVLAGLKAKGVVQSVEGVLIVSPSIVNVGGEISTQVTSKFTT